MTAPHHAQVDAVVIGAGFSGLYLLHKLRNEMGMSVRVFEAGSGVGGTWYWNRYPGARCDSDSYMYCYSFDADLYQEWEWSERYPQQPEILAYLEHVAERYDLTRDITLNARVVEAVFDETAEAWTVRTEAGETVITQYLITGVGCLSAWNTPPVPGLECFTGETYFTGMWPHEPVELEGKRVAVIGTGATGVQVIQTIGPIVEHLTVFQRTPNYIVPARHGPVPVDVVAARKRDFAAIWDKARNSAFGMPLDPQPKGVLESTDEEIEAVLENLWQVGGLGFMLAGYLDPLFNEAANRRVAAFLDRKIRERVKDPVVAELLTPKKLTYAVKRLPLDDTYYETFNLPHVDLVDISTNPIAEITPAGLKLTDGTEYPAQVLVFATGFDATTGTLNRINIRGRDGQLLRDKWADGPRTYLGMSSAGFPNLFMVTGPQSPGVLSNMPVSIEQHVEFISSIIGAAHERGVALIEPTIEAEDAWVQHNNEIANATLFPKAETTYTGGNIAGKPRVFLPNLDMVGGYRAKCAEVSANDYTGFTMTPAVAPAPA
jgi:cation diffusion facilitator CzcD-associated flavoprotein CzcO